MAKRKIFDELMEGVNAMKKHREGKLTLRSYKEEVTPVPVVAPKVKSPALQHRGRGTRQL
jgi:putative transcriptional regulator